MLSHIKSNIIQRLPVTFRIHEYKMEKEIKQQKDKNQDKNSRRDIIGRWASVEKLSSSIIW